MKKQIDNYEALGSSADKEGLHQALKAAGKETDHRYFAEILPDISGDKDYQSFLHCDGAGTKTIVSYLAYQESRNVQYFQGLAQDALVMNLDDVFCLGKPEKLVLANSIVRNPRLIPDAALEVIIKDYLQLGIKLRELGIDLEISGGETADCPDTVRTLVVDAVIFGRIKKSELISQKNITVGDVIVGIASTGKSSYEDLENSGIASNGLTLARHALISGEYKQKYPEIVDPSIAADLSYTGKHKIFEAIADGQKSFTLYEALASPTRTYAPFLSKLYDLLPGRIHGVIHNTGGGQTKVLRFAENLSIVKNNLFPVPLVFKAIQAERQVRWEEMYKVFNMGHRLEVYVPKELASQVIDTAKSFLLEAQIVGEVKELNSQRAKAEVVLETEQGRFCYTNS